MLADDLQDMPLEAFLAEVGEWTLDVYVPALGRGERLQPAVKPPFSFPRRLVASCGSSLSFQRLGRKLRVCVCVFVSCQEHAAVAQGLARYTGLSLDFVEASNLRIDDGKFRKELRKNTRNVLGAPPSPAVSSKRLDSGFHADSEEIVGVCSVRGQRRTIGRMDSRYVPRDSKSTYQPGHFVCELACGKVGVIEERFAKSYVPDTAVHCIMGVNSSISVAENDS